MFHFKFFSPPIFFSKLISFFDAPDFKSSFGWQVFISEILTKFDFVRNSWKFPISVEKLRPVTSDLILRWNLVPEKKKKGF